MSIDINLLIAKRTEEIAMNDMQGLTYMAALQKAKREFEKKEKTEYEILIHDCIE